MKKKKKITCVKVVDIENNTIFSIEKEDINNIDVVVRIYEDIYAVERISDDEILYNYFAKRNVSNFYYVEKK